MVLFPIIIIASFVMYIYYKVAILSQKDSLSQVYTNSKARISLGTFITVFGLYQYTIYGTRLSLFIGIIFVVFGIMQLTRGFSEAKHYKREWRRLNP
ncbi:MAG TPA: YtpI family protein [Virgibacillus sp.]|nr:YtpI family protein [Virgibacillus sp.]